jgi:hypothetical protein
MEVTTGLAVGDEVVVGPYKILAKLTDGRKVLAKPVADTSKQLGK